MSDTDQPTAALVVRDPSTPVAEAQPGITPAQAKVDAISALTMTAYQRASQLNLTDAEVEALAAEFPDEAFKPGAAGKENLIYIEHAFLRDRLNKVFRPGQWAIVPRNRWAEDFKTRPSRDHPQGMDASRVYVEAMLCIRGCFAAEAVGEMEYYPHNAGQNYGDAVEGAKTAALRRCCKELGIGLQAWKKDWCEGWWQRRRNGQRPSNYAPPSNPPPRPAPTAPVPRPAPRPTPTPTQEQREKMCAALADCEALAVEYLEKLGWLMPTEKLPDLPLRFVPSTVREMESLKNAIAGFGNGEQALAPYVAHDEPLETKPTKASPAKPATKPITVPRDKTPDGIPDEPWAKVIVPVPHRGEKRDAYLKNPDTIGSLYAARHNDEEARSRLFGFAYNYTPSGWSKRDGTQMPPSDADKAFRAALDDFLQWFQAEHPDEANDPNR